MASLYSKLLIFKIFNIFISMLHNYLDMFKKRENIVEIEEGKLLSPKFDNDGLIPVITMCSKTKDILMHGYMNVEAFKKTIETKEAHYFSRSRQQIWHKGKTSGFTQKVTEIRIDDDQDSIWLTVDIGDGSSCHVGYRSCFYRSIPLGPIENGREIEMKFEEKEKSFDPDVVYKGQPNPKANYMEEKKYRYSDWYKSMVPQL